MNEEDLTTLEMKYHMIKKIKQLYDKENDDVLDKKLFQLGIDQLEDLVLNHKKHERFEKKIKQDYLGWLLRS